MKRYQETVVILLMLFGLTILWAAGREKSKSYRQYQRIYQARKIAHLQVETEKASSPEVRDAARRLILALRRDLPAVQETVLAGNRRERCLSCHIGIEPIGAAHPPETFGCTVCHGGDPLSVRLPQAHAGLIGGRNPSDFRVIDESCGRTMSDGTACHNGDAAEGRDHIQRVRTTIMATKAGEAALPRYAFGAQKERPARVGVSAIQGKPPDGTPGVVSALRPLPYTEEADLPRTDNGELLRADPTGVLYEFSGHRVDTQLHQNCVNQCHLWTAGREEPYRYRASGCAACHYLYEDQAYYRGDDPTISRDAPGHGAVHSLTLKIPYTQCNHCHNRGNHDLQRMAFDRRTDLDDWVRPAGESSRLIDYYNPMTLFTRCELELDCIDCHTDSEVMGDGYLYSDQRGQQRIRCDTCHGTLERPPVLRELSGEEPPKVQRIMRGYGREPGEAALFSEEGEILPHVRREGGRLVLTGKATGKTFVLPLVHGSQCRQDPKALDANSCHQCHDIHLRQEGHSNAPPS
jgi:hypothetical protein